MDNNKMLFGYNNIMNMLGMGNQNNMYGSNCLGSSYGNFSNINIFGNGFNYGNSYGCNNIDYDAMAGANLGQSLIGILGAACESLVGHASQNSKAGLAERGQVISKEIQDLNTELENQDKVITNYKDQFDSSIDRFDNNKKILEAHKSTIEADNKTCNNYATNRAALVEQLNKETDTTKKAEIQAQIDTLDNEYNAAKTRVEIYDEALKAANNEIDEIEALSAKLDEEYQKFQELAEKKDAKIKELYEIKGNFDNKVLNTGDGNILNRLNADKYEEKFDENGDLKKDAEVDKATLRRAFYNYRKATPEEQSKIKKQISELWPKLPEAEKTESLKAAYKVVFS